MCVDDFPMLSLLELGDEYVKQFAYFHKYEPLRTPLRTMLTNYCLVLIGLASSVNCIGLFLSTYTDYNYANLTFLLFTFFQ